MKTIILSLVLLTSLTALSEVMDSKKAILSSVQYKNIQKKYSKLGGEFKCNNFKVVSSTDLKAQLTEYTMVAQAVIADCRANPNDGGDPMDTRLLAFVTVTTDHSEKQTSWNVESVTTVTPPQAD